MLNFKQKAIYSTSKNIKILALCYLNNFILEPPPPWGRKQEKKKKSEFSLVSSSSPSLPPSDLPCARARPGPPPLPSRPHLTLPPQLRRHRRRLILPSPPRGSEPSFPRGSSDRPPTSARVGSSSGSRRSGRRGARDSGPWRGGASSPRCQS